MREHDLELRGAVRARSRVVGATRQRRQPRDHVRKIAVRQGGHELRAVGRAHPDDESARVHEIGRTTDQLTQFFDVADTTKIGSWGLLYLICGALAGQSLEWKSRVFENIETGYEVFRQWASGKESEMDLAFAFKKLILKWAQDPTSLTIARQRLDNLERRRGNALSDNGRQQFLDYGRLAIMLNSLSELDTNEVLSIRRWASEHDQGWAILFFGAGILLSVDTQFPWPSIGSGLLMSSHSAKDKVKMLLNQYSRRDSSKIM